MSQVDLEYAKLLRTLLAAPVRKDRTGTGTHGIFGYQMRFNLEDEFPLLTTKKVFWRGIVAELLWFLSGSTNSKVLEDQGVHIWADWADEDGSLGPIYSHQWRKWGPGIDQIADVIDAVIDNPYSRRHIVSAWNVTDIEAMALPPCHAFFQFYVDNEDRLSCQLYQRSADVLLGLPFNIAQYALLTHMIAHVTGLGVGELVWTGGDVHLYLNHVEQAREQLTREGFDAPQIKLNPAVFNIDHFDASDIELVNYKAHAAISAKVSV